LYRQDVAEAKKDDPMIKLTPGKLTLPQLRRIARERVQLELDPASHAAIDDCAKAVEDIAEVDPVRRTDLQLSFTL
jgi:hypothetical protein